VNVLPEEYVRLLGYPRGWVLEGRALELADWARDWYAENGRPWFYARQAESFEITAIPFTLMECEFTSKRLQEHAAASGSPQRDSGRRWRGP
jgi:hypothetical protein